MATIRNIAERAGVSIGTVDRVIHERGKVSPAAEARVREAIDELGYQPNLFARHLKLKKTFVLGVLMPEPTMDGGYWECPAQGIRRAAAELAGQQVEVSFFHHDRYSEDSLRARFEEALAGELDGLLVAPVFPAVCRELFGRIPTCVPLVFIDSDVPNVERLSFIGQDSFGSGRLAAQLLFLTAAGRRRFTVIRVLPTDFHIEERVRGFLSFFTERHGVYVEECDVRGSDDQDSFDRRIDSITPAGAESAGLFVTNASTYRVARAVEHLGPIRRPTIVGYDLIEENTALLKAGEIDFLISQVPERQGYEGIYALYRHLVLREEVSPRISMPLDIVTRENVDFYPS